MSKKVRGYWIAAILIVIPYLILFAYNVIYNKEFFNAPIYHLLNIAIAVVFAYYFAQKRTDERKLKEIVENVIDKIQEFVDSEDAYSFNGNYDRRKILHMLRNTNNKINILSSINKKLNMGEEVDNIEQDFKTYREFVSDHISDIDHLAVSEIELRRVLSLINNHCDKLKIKLYQ